MAGLSALFASARAAVALRGCSLPSCHGTISLQAAAPPGPLCSATCTAAAHPPQPQVCSQRPPTFSSPGPKILTPVLLKATEPDRATRCPECTRSATSSPLTNSPPSISWLPGDRSSSRSHTPPAAAAPTGLRSVPHSASPGAT